MKTFVLIFFTTIIGGEKMKIYASLEVFKNMLVQYCGYSQAVRRGTERRREVKDLSLRRSTWE